MKWKEVAYVQCVPVFFNKLLLIDSGLLSVLQSATGKEEEVVLPD